MTGMFKKITRPHSHPNHSTLIVQQDYLSSKIYASPIPGICKQVLRAFG